MRPFSFGALAGFDGVEKGVELQLQRLGGFDRQLLEGDALGSADRENRRRLLRVIERNILPGLEKAELSTFSVETRLAVRLAMQPSANSSRTFAISTFGERIEIPAARMSFNSRLASASTISRSWIIRSSTTSTSRLRSVNTLMRWISKNSGSVAACSSAITAGLKRSRCPTWRIRLLRFGGVERGGRLLRAWARWASRPERRCRLRAGRSRSRHA